MPVILKTEGLRKTYRLGGFLKARTVKALDDINLTVESDRPVIISIVGESGSGKTTLAKTLLRLVDPDAGRVHVYDQQVAGKGALPSRRAFLSTVQPIFQNPFEAFSRYRPVDAYLHDTATRVAGLTGSAVEAAMDRALTAVGLDLADVAGKYSNQFSGGELQRVSIARALIPDPKLIVADEPVSMIDASRRMIIINLFKRLRDEQGRSFVYITHDLATAYYISDFVAVMSKGRIVEFGPAQQVMSNPQHDYTRLLLSSIPTTRDRWRPRRPTEGPKP